MTVATLEEAMRPKTRTSEDVMVNVCILRIIGC